MMMVCQHAKKRTRAGVKGRQLAKTCTCVSVTSYPICHFSLAENIHKHTWIQCLWRHKVLRYYEI